MRTVFLFLLLTTAGAGHAQYYYKDIIGTTEAAESIRNYQTNKVRKVVLNSYDANNTRNPDFFVEQRFDGTALTTLTRSGDEDVSVLVTYINSNGQVTKTIDSAITQVSTTFYTYTPDGLLSGIISTSTDTSGKFSQKEEHRWEYNAGKATRMLRIKNGVDTSVVSFKLDEKGNIVEEQSIRRGVKSDPVYYYYDAQNRLTDIVRFNNKARRLLPEYLFEYSATNQVIQKITVPGNSSNYLIWRYQYGSDGLKTKEAIYNKQKQLTGKIEYVYQRG